MKASHTAPFGMVCDTGRQPFTEVGRFRIVIDVPQVPAQLFEVTPVAPAGQANACPKASVQTRAPHASQPALNLLRVLPGNCADRPRLIEHGPDLVAAAMNSGSSSVTARNTRWWS